MIDPIQPPRLKFNPDYAIPPGETLKEVLEDRGLTPRELAKKSGISLFAVYGVLAGWYLIDSGLAKRLEKALGTPASFWIKREQVYREGIKRND